MFSTKALVLAAFFIFQAVGPLSLKAQPVITPCSSAFTATEMVIGRHHPHPAFFTSGAVVKHISTVKPGGGPCGFGPQDPDIVLGPGFSEARGIALDGSGNLFVAAGKGAATSILKIAPPYDGTPTVFFSGASNLRDLAIRGSVLYAADFGAGTVLRFNLDDGPAGITRFASIPGVFGIFVSGKDDLFVTSNAGGGGSNEIKRVTRNGVAIVATGLSLPEGITGDREKLYVASGGGVLTILRTGGTAALYVGNPVRFSHALLIFEHGGYVTDSNGPNGHAFKFTPNRP